jgi:hypothetical protein
MSESRSTPSSKGTPPPARNPVELILVRGLIVALLVAVAIEGIQWNSHKTAVAALSQKLKAVEDDPKIPEVNESDVKAILGSKQPVRTELYPASGGGGPASKKLEVYSWFSLNPLNKRELWIHYGRKGVKDEGAATVVAVSTDDQEPKSLEIVDSPAPSTGGPGAGPMVGGPPPGMMGGPGGAGGGRRGAQGRPGPAPGGEEAKPDADASKPTAETADDKNPEPEKSEAKPEADKN